MSRPRGVLKGDGVENVAENLSIQFLSHYVLGPVVKGKSDLLDRTDVDVRSRCERIN